MSLLAAARIDWSAGQPRSLDYNDIYSSTDGINEVHRVLLQPVGISASQGVSQLTVAELGFGTGLNLAVLIDQALASNTRLHFISFDAHPLHQRDFERIAAKRMPGLPCYGELLTRYPPLIPGWHRRTLAGGRITCSLFWGDVLAGLDDLSGRLTQRVDAWFLDGFTPDRNPAMWTQDVFNRLPALSAQTATVSTFTSVGRVRRGLQSVGFNMRRVDQQPIKLHSLAGELHQKADRPVLPAHVNVIGAGISGASVAGQLARQGVSVSVFDQADHIAAGASGISVSVLHGRLQNDDTVAAAVRAHGYLFAADFTNQLMDDLPSGVLQLAPPDQQQRLRAIGERYQGSGDWIELVEPAAQGRWSSTGPGLKFRHGRALNLRELSRRLLDHPNIELRLGERISALPPGETVLACAVDCQTFAAARHLEIAPVHGQIDRLLLDDPPPLPIVGDGYVVPDGSSTVVGATYEYRPWSEEAATQKNLEQLESGRKYQWQNRERATRCVSS
ncbi:MAG: tRNA (5-methylaminomethyl-2-thiouridine)(34)-methyltransferase MnmD, partial [Proteobacteria bacterium]|nr:tRNA (5-methylaminomethyl-2-thiouridine)(34)-methyltransferase MnmD [Pseudomonadota bacterium]